LSIILLDITYILETTLLYFFVFIFGSIIGSFLNVVILRFNTGRGLAGRSGCFTCGKTLHWHELVPIISFLFLRGKCGECKAKISVQYPLIEILAGCLFVFFAIHDGLFVTPGLISSLTFTLNVAIWSTLVVILVYDLRHMIIPDSLCLLFIALTVVRLFSFWKFHILSASNLINYGLTGAILSGFFLMLWLISGGRWIGLGDVKLAVGMGLYLGLAEGLSSFALAFWIGAAFALLQMLVQFIVGKLQLRERGKSITMKSEIPFAPFLILGMLLAYIYSSDIFHLSLFLS